MKYRALSIYCFILLIFFNYNKANSDDLFSLAVDHSFINQKQKGETAATEKEFFLEKFQELKEGFQFDEQGYLTHLELDMVRVDETDEMIANFINCKKLRVIDLNYEGVTDAGLKLLSSIKSIESLNLRGCSNITDKGVSYLGSLQHLKKLNLGVTKITGKCFAGFKSNAKLEELDLYSSSIDNAALLSISKFTNLTDLVVSENLNLTSVGLRGIHRLKKLENLSLTSTKIDDTGIEKLKSLKSLRTLDLVKLPITNKAMKHLAGMTKLHTLRISQTQIGDEGMLYLTAVENLEYLYSVATPVTNKGVKILSELKQLSHLSLHATCINEDVLELLLLHKNLQSVSVNDKITSRKSVRSLLKKHPKLIRVYWGKKWSTTEDKEKLKNSSARH